MRFSRLWAALALIIIGSFATLGYFGRQIYHQKPPIPQQVVDPAGKILMTAQQISDGQNVWQSMGGQEVGSIWGHGAYVAPDWSADYLHRQSLWLLEHWAQQTGSASFAELSPQDQDALKAKLRREIRPNTFDKASGVLSISADRALAIAAMDRYYGAIFSDAVTFPDDLKAIADGGYSPAVLRTYYAIASNSVPDPERRQLMTRFFFWAAWSCSTERPAAAVTQAPAVAVAGVVEGQTVTRAPQLPPSQITYSNNWPGEELIGNRPSGALILWSVVSVVVLLAGVGGLVWYHAAQGSDEPEAVAHSLVPNTNPLLAIKLTASMRATLKYFWVVTALIVAQVGLGGITAHYGVEGGFYGFPLADYLPYAVTRTWHTQLGIFWIATAWLATGLFVAPAISGYEPKFQRAGVNFLFTCLLIIVVGSMFGTWYATRQKMGLDLNFWFGHQGYEYVDLGRFWQIFLLVGLVLWLGLMARALLPALRKAAEHKHLLAMFLLASVAIALFYSAGLMWGRQTHLALAEYWRWWVIHLWVEGFFEVFATAVLGLLFARMGLIRVTSASRAVLFSTCIFLTGGIIGTFHHLYFTGTPTAVLALGAVFSALEIVPLVLVGVEAYSNLKLMDARPWVRQYCWPILFFVAVAFWNLVGAGLFGFLINPPVALYYMQGLNTTPVHGHTALFGVYGMLGIGLMLFCLKAMDGKTLWRTPALAFAFWTINGGLALMVLISLLPVGLMQTWASIEHGMWYARSAQFLQTPLMDLLRWLRVFGDSVFSMGVLALAYFVLGLKTGWSLQKGQVEETTDAARGVKPVAVQAGK